MPSLNSRTVLAMTRKDFATILSTSEPSYNTLNRYRKVLTKSYKEDEDKDTLRKLTSVEKIMKDLVKDGESVKRRKAGTGTRVEKELEYKDTAANRKLDRVGKKYTRVVWQDAEFEEKPRKVRKRRRVSKPQTDETGEAVPKKKNLWITAVARAKEELDAPKMLIIRREARNPENPDEVFGVKVYERAVEIMRKAREEESAAAAPSEEVTL